MLTKYANIFGAPNTGVHAYRLCGIAIVDFAATIIAAYIIAKLISKSFLLVFAVLMVLGIVAHLLFGVKTALNKKLFYDE